MRLKRVVIFLLIYPMHFPFLSHLFLDLEKTMVKRPWLSQIHLTKIEK